MKTSKRRKPKKSDKSERISLVRIISKLALAFEQSLEDAAYRHEAITRILADHDKLIEHVGTLSAHCERLVMEKEDILKNIPTLPHWTEEQRRAFLNGLTDRQIKFGLQAVLNEDAELMSKHHAPR